jgi:3-methyladenine DNA glycosylase AlkD
MVRKTNPPVNLGKKMTTALGRRAPVRAKANAENAGTPQELADFVQERFASLADPARAVPMAAYMRTTQPFHGVAKPLVEKLCKEALGLFPCEDPRSYRENVLALWRLPNREEKYLAIGYARQRKFITLQALPLYEQMIREGQWWDLVDETASYLVGGALGTARKQVEPVLDAWVKDPDMWIRRTALLSQLRLKQATNQKQLFRYSLLLAGEREFFIRKAIGWALREYSKTEPEAAIAFLKSNRSVLSPLSVREGARHLVRQGKLPQGFEKLKR